MRLLLLNSLYPPQAVGGAERSVALLAEALAARGHEVAAVSLATPGVPAPGERGGVTRFQLPLRNAYWPFGETAHGALGKAAWHALDAFNPWMARELRAVIGDWKPEVVHTNNLGGFSVAAWQEAARSGAKVVHTLRDYYLCCPKTTMFKRGARCTTPCLDCRMLSLPKRGASRHVRAVAGISRFILARHESLGYFPQATLRTVIPNPEPAPPDARARSGADVHAVPRVGFLGQLAAHKGVGALLDAASRFSPRDLELWIAGKGDADYEARLRRLTGEPGTSCIRYQGYVNPGEFLSRVDALIVPSLWDEPFGRVILEARAHGLPVAASARGGIPELLQPGPSSILFDPEPAESLADALRALAALARERRAGSGVPASGWAELLPERIAEQYERVYARA